MQGGSTITQQYVKNAYLTGDRTLSRKLREAILATQLERRMSKEDILFNYLNTVYFGSGAYGVGAAAQSYFGKPVNQLTLSESAMLAGLIPAPTDYSPRVDSQEAEHRRQIVLGEMLEEELISQAEHDQAKALGLWLTVDGPAPAPATLVQPQPTKGAIAVPALRRLGGAGHARPLRPREALPGWAAHRDDHRPPAAVLRGAGRVGPPVGHQPSPRHGARDRGARHRPGARHGRRARLRLQPGEPGARRRARLPAGLVVQDVRAHRGLRAGHRPRHRRRRARSVPHPRLRRRGLLPRQLLRRAGLRAHDLAQGDRELGQHGLRTAHHRRGGPEDGRDGQPAGRHQHRPERRLRREPLARRGGGVAPRHGERLRHPGEPGGAHRPDPDPAGARPRRAPPGGQQPPARGPGRCRPTWPPTSRTCCRTS